MIYKEKSEAEYSFGNMDSRVTITRQYPAQAPDGSVALNWTTLHSNLKAKVFEGSGNGSTGEKAEASTVYAQKKILVYLRFSPNLALKMTDVILYKLGFYDIENIDTVFGRQRFLKINCIARDIQ